MKPRKFCLLKKKTRKLLTSFDEENLLLFENIKKEKDKFANDCQKQET
jgi:hypothetical protein